jgi:hypothetical protein
MVRKCWLILSYRGYLGYCQYLFLDISCFFAKRRFVPTEKPKVLITFDEKLLKRIEDFRFENRVNTRSEAIRRLLEEALMKYEKKPKK